MSDPLPVIPLEYAKPEHAADLRYRRWQPVVRVCALLACLCCVVGWALITFYDVESVLATGPVLFGLGALTFAGGLFTRSPLAWSLGVAHCCVCLLFVALVNLLSWSPSDAEWPFTVMSSVYAPFAVALTVVLWVRRQRPHV